MTFAGKRPNSLHRSNIAKDAPWDRVLGARLPLSARGPGRQGVVEALVEILEQGERGLEG